MCSDDGKTCQCKGPCTGNPLLGPLQCDLKLEKGKNGCDDNCKGCQPTAPKPSDDDDEVVDDGCGVHVSPGMAEDPGVPQACKPKGGNDDDKTEDDKEDEDKKGGDDKGGEDEDESGENDDQGDDDDDDDDDGCDVAISPGTAQDPGAPQWIPPRCRRKMRKLVRKMKRHHDEQLGF